MNASKRPRDLNLLRFRNALRGAKNFRDALSVARRELDVANIPAGIDWVCRTPFRGRKIELVNTPQKLSDIHSERIQRRVGFPAEFLWAAEVLLRYTDQLSLYINGSTECSSHILRSQFDEALAALDRVDRAAGYSLWSLKLRIAITQEKDGFEAQKSLSTKIISDLDTDNLVKFITSWASFRNESVVTPANFFSEYRRHEDAFEIPREVRQYLTYQITTVIDPTPDYYASVLNLASTASPIDYFEAFVAVSSSAVRHAHSNLLDGLSGPLSAVARAIPDRRLRSYAFALSHDAELSVDTIGPLPDPIDLYLRGDFDAFIDDAETSLTTAPTRIDLLELVARARVNTVRPVPQSSLVAQIDKAIGILVQKESTVGENVIFLQKLALNFNPFDWAEGLWTIASSEIDPRSPYEALHIKSSLLSPSPYLNPLCCYSFPPKRAHAYLQVCRTALASDLGIAYAEYASGISDELPADVLEENKLLVRAERYLRRKDFVDGEKCTSKLLNSGKQYFRLKGVKLHSLTLLDSQQLRECLGFVTSEYLKNPNILYVLPITELAMSIMQDASALYKGDPSIPILFDIYSRHVGPKFDTERRFYFEDFLGAHTLSRPSELRRMTNAFPPDKLVYLLRNVCVPQVMDVAPVFETSSDLENERIAVCDLLAEIDSSNADEYRQEIKDIIIRQNALRGVFHVERSKIFVDEDAIRKSAELSLRETYERYRLFGGYDPEEAEEVEQALQKAIAGDRDAFLRLEVEPNEKNSILARLLIELRDAYVSGPDNSLDVYLSTRIRHGTFAAQLRSAPEAYHLITQRDKLTGNYRANDFWNQRLLVGHEAGEIHLNSPFSKFSRAFDDLIQELLSTWIQVRTAEEGVGLFDFRLIPAHAKLIATYLQQETSFEEFIEVCFSLFRRLLLENVTGLRTKFTSEVSDRVDVLLSHLEVNVLSVVERNQDETFSLAVANAKADLHRTITRIADWFTPPTSAAYAPFTLADPVRIAAELMRRVYGKSDFDVRLKSTSTLTLVGQALTAFVDIFTILFENAIKHSGFPSPPEVRVIISETHELILVDVSNDVTTPLSADVMQKLAQIRTALEDGQSGQGVRTEGGTGFLKISRIIRNDLRCSGMLEFDFLGDDQFRVQMALASEMLVAQ